MGFPSRRGTVVGFVDLGDDGRQEVILETIEEGRELVRAATVTLRGLAATTLEAERRIDGEDGSLPDGPFTAEGVECDDYDDDGSMDLLVVSFQPADDLVHVEVAAVRLTEQTTAIEVGVDSYEIDVAAAFDRWKTPLLCRSDDGFPTGVRYGANGWGRVDYGDAFASDGDIVLTAVAQVGSDGRFVAVGHEQPSPLIGEYFPTRATAWYSPNGVDWTRSSLEGEGELRDVIALPGGDGALAVGQIDRGTAAVWSSTDGEAWELVEVQPAVDGGSAGMLAITQGADGQLIVVGVETYPPDASGPGPDLDAAIWRSDDGKVWERMTSSALGAPGYQPNTDGEFNSEIVGVDYSAGAGYVAVGSASRSGDDQMDFPTQYPAVWVSGDGGSWERHALDGEFRLRGVTAVGGSLVAYGVSTLHGSPTADAVILVSGDGITWTEAAGEFDGLDQSDGVQSVNAVVEVSDTDVLALGSDDVEFEAKGAAAVWRAAHDDLDQWAREPHDDDVFEKVAESPTAVMTDGTWTGEALVVVGFSGESLTLENGAVACCVIRPAVWMWEKGATP
ncbi:MAG TPA: hypothetical protein VF148_13495 [Acidimicrobiia bacterium]